MGICLNPEEQWPVSGEKLVGSMVQFQVLGCPNGAVSLNSSKTG